MNPEQTVGRKRRTQAEIEQLVTEFLSSGMREVEFCRNRGLSWDTLNRHLKKQGQKQDGSKPRSRLVRVKITGRKSLGQRNSAGLAVELGKGRRIEVRPGFDVPTLERLVQVLEQV